LGLACTLVRPPRLLLLDEPTAGVDPVSRRELWTIVGEAVAAEGMSVLLSTAYLDEADRCDEVALVDEGRVLGMGTPESFREPMRGRTFLVTAGAVKSRTLQESLADAEGVADAVVQGQRVRLVVDAGRVAAPETILPGVESVSIEPVEPRFEDGFVATLRAAKGQPPRQPDDPSANADQSSPLSQRERECATAPGDSTEPIVEVRDVRRRFGRFYAVKGVSFDVRRGEIFGLLGANGAGKSTTFRMLCGLLPPSAGALRVAGVDVRRAAAAARARIGYMPQKFSLYGTLSVEQNLRFFSSAYGLTGRRRAERIAWAVDKFAMHDWRGARGEDLPLGYKKRLSMACALMHDPDVLFLDEPTSGVDPLARREFWREINALAAQGVTVMVTTHFMEEAEYCDRMAIMAAGEILCEGTPDEIRATAERRNGREPTIEDAFIGLIERREQQPREEEP
jgi:ABC-2 type transport system ATP-binding protein